MKNNTPFDPDWKTYEFHAQTGTYHEVTDLTRDYPVVLPHDKPFVLLVTLRAPDHELSSDEIMDDMHYYQDMLFDSYPLAKVKLKYRSERVRKQSKFDNVSCSQCGRDFGPGDHGYSHCSDHRSKRINKRSPVNQPV